MRLCRLGNPASLQKWLTHILVMTMCMKGSLASRIVGGAYFRKRAPVAY